MDQSVHKKIYIIAPKFQYVYKNECILTGIYGKIEIHHESGDITTCSALFARRHVLFLFFCQPFN